MNQVENPIVAMKKGNTIRSIRVFYFLNFFMHGVFMPFFGLYLLSLLRNSVQVGMILAINPMVKLIFQPVWAMASKKKNLQRQYLSFSLLLLAIASLGFVISRSFAGYAFTMFIFSIFEAPYMPMGTTISINYLSRINEQSGFGKIRLWGTVGFIFSSTLIGPLLIGKNNQLFPVIFAICALISALASLKLPLYSGLEESEHKSVNGSLLQNRQFLFFLTGIVLVGFSAGIIGQYFAIYLSSLHASSLAIGLSASVAALSEIPLMARSSKLISKFGLEKLFLFGVGITVLRFFLFIVVKNSQLLLLVQLLHGFLITSMLVVGPIYITKVLPEPQHTLGQGMYSAAYSGIGTSIGLVVAGWIYTTSGMSFVWLTSLLVSLIATALLYRAIRLNPKS